MVVVFYVPTVLYCSTDLLYMCSKQKHKADHGTTGTRRDTHHGHKKGTQPRASQGRALELELIQTQMAQKPMLRAEVGMRVRCANKASAE